jgi:undecaprenyl-diphosphatase
VTSPLTDQHAVAQRARDRAPFVHADLPATPSSALRSHPRLLLVLSGVFLALAVSASVAGSQLLLTWDEPITRWVEEHRTAWLDDVFRGFSRLGATIPVLVVGTLIGIAAWRRCRAVAIAVVVATYSKPLFETVLKTAVDRERPAFQRMVPGNGPSFPSGHVMAAMALWGMLPLIVSLYTRRRDVWWGSVAVAATIVGGIAASRVYLGVHWFSDVVGGVLAGSLFLLAIQALYDHQHRRHGCARWNGDGDGRAGADDAATDAADDRERPLAEVTSALD